MKKLLLACVLLTALALPAFADGGNLSVAGSLDFNLGWYDGLGVSAHVAYAPTIVDKILRLGVGGTFQLPLQDVSQLAVYGTAYWFPIPTFVQNKREEWYDKWYLRLNLGFNIPLIHRNVDTKGGFYSGFGTGYEVTKTFFIEFIYGHYAWSLDGHPYTIGHLTFGVRI